MGGIHLRARVDLAVLVEGDPRPVAAESLALADALADFTARAGAGKFGGLLEGLPESGGRAGVQARALEGASGEIASVPLLEGRSVSWSRAPMGAPDTMTVRIDRARFPVDAGLYQGAQVAVWLYTHDNPAECQNADPGQFVGVVRKVSRQGEDTTLSCSDMTALPMAEDVEPATLEALDLDQPLWRVVQDLIRTMPGGSDWEVSPRGRIAEEVRPGQALAEERVRRYPAEGAVRTAPAPELAAAGKLVAAGFTDGAINLPAGSKAGRYSTDLRNPTSVAALEAQGLNARLTADLVGAIVQGKQLPTTGSLSYSITTRPARVRRSIIPPKVRDVFGAGRLKYWDAVLRLCALMGVVPDVGTLADGKVGIVLVDAEELHAGQVFRPFGRDGRKYRVLTLGSTCELLSEDRDLVLGRRFDRVVAVSPNPETGKTITAEYGRTTRDGATQNRTEVLTVPRVTDPGHLQRIAAAAWMDLAAGEYRIRVAVDHPWTDGGGHEDADLLYCAVGATLVLRLRDLREDYGGATGNATTLEELLRRAGLSAAAADILQRAADRQGPALLFQVAAVEHTYSGTSYRCNLTLQRFLASRTAKLLGGRTADVNTTAQTLTAEGGS